jgi:hypothetical protein
MADAALEAELGSIGSIAQAVRWASGRVPPAAFVNAVAQDEFTHDVVVKVGERTYAVFDTT